MEPHQPERPNRVPLAGLCIGVPGILLVSHSSALPLAVFGIAKSFSDANMMPILTLITDARYRATGYGILNLCSTLIGGLSIYVGSDQRGAQFNVSLVFHFGAVGMAACAA